MEGEAAFMSFPVRVGCREALPRTLAYDNAARALNRPHLSGLLTEICTVPLEMVDKFKCFNAFSAFVASLLLRHTSSTLINTLK